MVNDLVLVGWGTAYVSTPSCFMPPDSDTGNAGESIVEIQARRDLDRWAERT